MKSTSSLCSPSPSLPPAPVPLISSSLVTGCPELDLSVLQSPVSKIGPSQLQSCSKGQTRKKVCFEEPVVAIATTMAHDTRSRDATPEQPSRGHRKNRGCHHANRQLVQLPVAAPNQDPGCLEKAELNTTVALMMELQSLQGVQFDLQRAVQEALHMSERTKNLINTRATEVVNVARSQHLFTSLVSVNVQKDQLISPVLATNYFSSNIKAADGPSLHFFMSSDMVRQKPLPTEVDPVHFKPKALSRPTHSIFDLYRRQRQWEAMP